jgi:glycine/D-amino acid oxidase-like deaminating enzyme
MVMGRIGILPADDRDNGWGRYLRPRQPRAELEEEVRADWVVVGAGFAGLAASRRLAENRPNDSIVLIDAQAVADGASGRNSGFALDLPQTYSKTPAELENSKRRVRLSRAAIAYLDECVTKHEIACQWRRQGKYHAVLSARGKELVLDPFVRELKALKEPYRYLDREDVAQETGSACYHAAIFTPGCALMNPVALTRGLADTLPKNVSLYENSPVTVVEYRNGVSLSTRKGKITASNIIVATDGFAEQFGIFRGRLLIFALYASLSRPLTTEECAALSVTNSWGLTSASNAAGVTVRFTEDRRILIRQKFEYKPSFRSSKEERAAVRLLHQKAFERRFPMLPRVTMQDTWTGFVCVSRNNAFGFGKMAPNVYAAVCQNSIGVTMGTISGMLAADLAAGRDNPLVADLAGLGIPSRLPPRPLLDLGVQSRFAWDLWKYRAEQ